MQKITTRNEYDVQDHGSVIEEKHVVDPKHFLSCPSCHIYDNDYFIDQLGEERSVDMTCMLDDVFYTDDFPKFDQYDDDYVLQTEANVAGKLAIGLWKEEVQFQQLEYIDQSMHISYGSEEESAKNFEVSEGYFPFCFTLFQIIKDNFRAIINQPSMSFDLDHLEDNEILVQDFSYLDLQPLNVINCQVVDEDSEARTYDQMMQDDSVPLCFESFQVLKGILHSISSNEQPVENHAKSLEPIQNVLQQYFQVFHDPIADVLDDVCSQSPSPLANCELERSIDTSLIL